ncbi:MAG: sn-glycerol-3-phosphate ABC transporter ATP-binding protein UgpC [Gemmatimonadales bacterium]
MARVTLEGIRKIYEEKSRQHVVVHGIDLVIPDGEFLVLVGPSGCGKSTTLRMIAGLEEISAGTLRIGDRVVNDVPARDRDIAMVFQNYALYPHMTVRENLAFALQLRKMSPGDIATRVNEAAELLGLTELLERRPRQLSGGQRQRVALGRAIVRQPQVFLFDEPLSNLDAKLRVQMRREIAALRRRLGTTTVYVTHDQVEAMTLGDRIVVMQEGRVQQVDTPLELYRRPANTFVATFVGSPPMNLVPGSVTPDGAFRARDGALSLPLPGNAKPAALAAGRQVTLGIRPEALGVGGGSGVPASIVEIEPLGNETLVSLDAGGVTLTARLDGGASCRRGEQVGLAFPADQLHWFDESGARLA